MEKIRLIIWDLDETFWNGTLSEGKIIIPENRFNIIKTLSERGIVNSISSKNDFEKVKIELEKVDLWKYFVFPKINWETKGLQVKNIIDSIKLRPQTVLFIDDNKTNLEEVKFYNPGIEVAEPCFIDGILDNEYFQGKDDHLLSRLNQYKVLERKASDEKKFGSNEEFLQQSGIQIKISRQPLNDYIDRIYELNQRTNQLNFTKNRCELKEIESLCSDTSYDCGCVSVKDNYGDYGIVGFFACKNNKLEHFYFSCRTIGLGVEQWVYSQLGFPSITIVGDVATVLKSDFIPQWINISVENHKTQKTINDKKILLIGGCDLEQTAFYLSQSIENFETQFNYNVAGRFVCHPEITEILRQSQELTQDEKSLLIEKCPFYDNNTFVNKLFDYEYDYVIFSPLIDTSVGCYKYKKQPNIKVFYGNSDYPDLTGQSYLDDSQRIKFFEDFEFEGRIDSERFLENLIWLRNKLSTTTKLIILNGSIIDVHHPYEPERYKVHLEFNEKINEFCKREKNVQLLDITKIITSTNDNTDNIRHYTREKYYEIANEILKMIGESDKIKSYNSFGKENISLKKEIKKLLRRCGLLDLAYKVKSKISK